MKLKIAASVSNVALLFCRNLFLLLFLILAGLSSDSIAQTDEGLTWKGVVIDKTRPEDVITKFGRADKDEVSDLDLIYLGASKLFTPTAAKKEWRVMRYKSIEQAKNVAFGFDKNGRLVFIVFSPSTSDRKKMVDVQAFLGAFKDVDFSPRAPRALAGYALYGKHKLGYVLANVERGAYGVLEGMTKPVFDTKTIEDVPNEKLDGIVTKVQFLSKSLENTQNTDVLR